MSCLLLFFSSLRDKQTRKRREKQNIENFRSSFSQIAKRRHTMTKRLSGYLPLEKRQKIDWLASKVWGLPFINRMGSYIWRTLVLVEWIFSKNCKHYDSAPSSGYSMLFHDSANPHQDAALSGLLPLLPTFFPLLSPLLLAHGSRQPKLHKCISQNQELCIP